MKRDTSVSRGAAVLLGKILVLVRQAWTGEKTEFFESPARCIAVLAMGLLMSLSGCQTGGGKILKGLSCSEIEGQINFSDRIGTLNRLADAFAGQCYDLVIVHGEKARLEFRHKTFSLVKETSNIFVPEGSFIDYVMESYERGYLSLLLAASYANVHKLEEAKVELRQLDHELFTPLYNYGEDPVNLLLSAVLWERVGAVNEARVDWLRLRDLDVMWKRRQDAVRLFAGQQVSRIDDGQELSEPWHVYSLDRFPELSWDLQFFGSENGYFSVTAGKEFPRACQSDTGVRLSTQSWFEKVAIRHSHGYHPLLNVQAWIRLPIGLTYSLVPLAAGAGVMVGGCALDVAAKGKGSLCQLSVIGGMALMSTAPAVLEGALQPDLRHWEHVPAAFVVTRASTPELEPCLPNLETAVQRLW
ncbi:MAG: hypothetical protein E8D41_00420 [Nitrospira sp.]|nr:MAG: hypothetical protein E8D41_00420 [Nitrospira sp.]